MDDYKKDYFGACVRNTHPGLIIRMRSGFAVLCDYQFIPGWCLLLGYPEPYSTAKALTDLSLEARSHYLLDTTLIGEALIKVCNPLRINYSTLMNSDAGQFLHTHIEARYEWEPYENRTKPTARYPDEKLFHKNHELNEQKHGDLKRKLAETLKDLMKKAYGEDYDFNLMM